MSSLKGWLVKWEDVDGQPLGIGPILLGNMMTSHLRKDGKVEEVPSIYM